ncbi:hypothetical protein LTR66_004790 [Elasticomyces elasticus]|nr:hypothetical protein LTR66_004790 [Elasticomyces elasticus]
MSVPQGLTVPVHASARHENPRSAPASSVHNRANDLLILDSFTPTVRSRANSDSIVEPASTGGGGTTEGTGGSADRPNMARPVTTDAVVTSASTADDTTFFIGTSHKPFHVPTALLKRRVPYFKKASQLAHTFEEYDEFAFRAFTKWIDSGKVDSPTDFHTLQHCICLYVIALRFEIESLQNHVMDQVRAHYRIHNMTASPFRLEHIYTATATPNHMRNFLITTAAYRALCEVPIAPNVYISDSMKGVLVRGSVITTDFVEALIKLQLNVTEDVRRGDPCVFHVHSGKKCEKYTAEPWQHG